MLKKPREKGRRLELLVAQKLRESGIDRYASRTPFLGAVVLRMILLPAVVLLLNVRMLKRLTLWMPTTNA